MPTFYLNRHFKTDFQILNTRWVLCFLVHHNTLWCRYFCTSVTSKNTTLIQLKCTQHTHMSIDATSASLRELSISQLDHSFVENEARIAEYWFSLWYGVFSAGGTYDYWGANSLKCYQIDEFAQDIWRQQKGFGNVEVVFDYGRGKRAVNSHLFRFNSRICIGCVPIRRPQCNWHLPMAIWYLYLVI